MKILKTIAEMYAERDLCRAEGKRIGFVPTMGFLHNGHLSLVDQCRKENDVTVVSVFVNPTQFGPGEDFDSYPRDIDADTRMLRERGVDILFFPDRGQLYPEGYHTYVEVEELDKGLCGSSRPSHFRGVTTIVLKLLNIVGATRAYFGRKDAQQAVIIKKMVQDLNMESEIRALPIVRDSDGLALSSRNSYLSPEQRAAALCFPRALMQAKQEIQSGLRDTAAVIKRIEAVIADNPLVQVDYISVVSLDRLQPLAVVDLNNTLVAGAVWVGKTRLIDNFILGEF
jgi:pantoate--beta-alanine ligase